MEWIKLLECPIKCPNDTNCYRPIEFTEPVLCKKITFIFQNNFSISFYHYFNI